MVYQKRCFVFYCVISLSLLLSCNVSGYEIPRFTLEFELGPVWQTRNDVQIPNDENGTRFSIVDTVGNGPYPAGRMYLSWNINQRHGLQALLAPLSFTEDGELDRSVKFAGEVFDPAKPTEFTYKFNSWRMTYRYKVFDKIRWNGWIGFTAKIRDAKIQLKQNEQSARDTDTGFVPLLHLGFHYQITDRWKLRCDADALAGGPGRAEDVAIKLDYALNTHWRVSGGYRMLEGGADVDDVYNFAWLHYLIFSVMYEF